MLTRDLLRYRVVRGDVRPRFIDLESAELLQLAGALLETAGNAHGKARGVLEDELAEHAPPDVDPPIVKGLTKLVLDRCEFADGEADYAGRRAELFLRSTELLRQCPDTCTLEDFSASLRQTLGEPQDLYGDLPDNRPLTSWRALTAKALLERYNMAQVQGLILASRTLRIRTRSRDILRIRRVLRWLKFCRLVADIQHNDDTWEVQITGPATLFDQAKKYGLQLAQFVPAVFVLDDLDLEAEIALRPGKVWHLRLTQQAALVSPHGQRLGHVPEEIAQVATAFDPSSDASWQLDPAVEPRHVGARDVMLPDLTFRHGDGRVVHIELFHRWHSHALTQRIANMAARHDPEVVLGIERGLLKSAPLQELVDSHPQVRTFAFSGFPTTRILRSALAAQPR